MMDHNDPYMQLAAALYSKKDLAKMYPKQQKKAPSFLHTPITGLIRLPILLVLTLALAYLVHFAYTTGLYVGDLRARIEAMDAGAGHYDIFHGEGAPAGWVWTTK